MEEKRKKVIRAVISAVLSLIFAAALTVLAVVFSLEKPLSKSGVYEAVDACGYTDGVTEKIKEEFELLCETSGVPPSLAHAFVEEELSREEMLHPIRQMFGEAGELIDKSLLQASLTARIEAYASSMRERGELEMSQEEWEEMKANFPQLSAFFVDEMEDAVNLNGVYSPLGSILSFASRLLPYLGWGCAVILLLSGGLLYLIHRKKVLYFVYLTFTAAGLLLGVPAAFLLNGNYVMRLGINPIYLRGLLSYIANSFFHRTLIWGLILLVLGIVCGGGCLYFHLKEKIIVEKDRRI
jgi:hypothetical protein